MGEDIDIDIQEDIKDKNNKLISKTIYIRNFGLRYVPPNNNIMTKEEVLESKEVKKVHQEIRNKIHGNTLIQFGIIINLISKVKLMKLLKKCLKQILNWLNMILYL